MILAADGHVVCSAFVIGPHTVLTAAHCGLGPLDFDQYSVSIPPATLALSDALPDPQFDPTTFDNDLAILTLRQAAAPAPLVLDTRTIDNSYVGQLFTVVGFGVTGANAGDAGQKRKGTAQVSAVGAVDFTGVAAPSQPCEGDSGGPALFSDGANTVVTGVVSHGDNGCMDHAVFARIDTGAAFIASYLQSIEPVATGARCLFDEQCNDGPCVVAADDSQRSFCAQSCKGDSDCPPSMHCAASLCSYHAPSPGALGAHCTQTSDCASGLCNDGACTQTCTTSCPAGYACTNTTDITFYCLRIPASGCAFAAHGEPSLAALALVLLLVRRRRRV